MSNLYGLVPWGIGYWGVPHPSAAPSKALVNVTNVQPTPGSYFIARNQTFTFTLKTKFPLNPSVIFVLLDNQVVINGAYTNPNFTVIITTNIDGISKDYQITPNYLFTDRAVFSLQISAADIYGNPSSPFWAGYIVADTRPPLLTPLYPLDGYTDVPLDLTIHFLVNQLIAPNNGLDLTTLNVFVDDKPAVINGILQSQFAQEYGAVNAPTVGDITSPIEVLLDYAGRYSPNDIVTVKVSVLQNNVVPVVGVDGYIYNDKGILVSNPITVVGVTDFPNAEYDLALGAKLTTYLLPNIIVKDGYVFKDDAGNSFNIATVGVQEIVVNRPTHRFAADYSFVTAQFYDELVTPIFSGYFQGTYLVDDLGDGKHINVSWHPARTTRPDNDLAYLIYYSTSRSDVFYEEPKLITTGRALPKPETQHGIDAQLFGFFAQIPLPVGVTYYFGVRATEFPHSAIPLIPADGYSASSAGLVSVDGYSFQIPMPQTLMVSTVGSGALVIAVTNTNGYKKAGGYILVGNELMRYTSLTPNTFIVPPTGRGLFGTGIITNHNVGEIVKMYYGNMDDNTVMDKGVVTWDAPNDPHRMRPDLITTDFSLEDGYHTGFEFFDYCGYHRARPDELLNDETCGTYMGGEFNGHRGMFIYDRVLANEEQLLEADGESTILLRRLQGGETCVCRTSRVDVSRYRSCSICFGTGFRGGYVQYRNPRRDDHRIMVHYAPADEELAMRAQAGWDQKYDPGTWTLPIPAIKDRDVLVRFNEFGEEEWRYVVDAASRVKGLFGRYGRQRLKLSRTDKTDMIYQFKIIL